MVKDYGEYFNLAHIEASSHIYGPGERFVVWFQGCKLACKGCWNREMWSFKSKQLIHKERLLEIILTTSNIKGVTFLGGEPMHQANSLWWLINQIRERTNLTIFLFTGYEQNELAQLGQLSNILENCDIVALGRYDENKKNINQQWIGSNNQIVIYPAGSRESEQPELINQVEIIIEADESIRILGFPDESLIKVMIIN
ncbi:4Fe-4S single cluster domain-containing protein [Oceanisphaera sp. W20_SRM_FM3]|uniref:4Fe-4S single cluster domain-containing protein n=1 Tax=Oceanisphaera sp. W20_SRM_FM3 TaxID=3240267 RepID=UPI003F9BF04F